MCNWVTAHAFSFLFFKLCKFFFLLKTTLDDLISTQYTSWDVYATMYVCGHLCLICCMCFKLVFINRSLSFISELMSRVVWNYLCFNVLCTFVISPISCKQKMWCLDHNSKRILFSYSFTLPRSCSLIDLMPDWRLAKNINKLLTEIWEGKPLIKSADLDQKN